MELLLDGRFADGVPARARNRRRVARLGRVAGRAADRICKGDAAQAREIIAPFGISRNHGRSVPEPPGHQTKGPCSDVEAPRVEFRHLRSFLTVAKHKSFTLAGEELFLTQSAVSQQIRALEALLGAPLFTRDRHAVDLTGAGRALLPQARQIISLVEATRSLVHPPHELAGSLCIAAATVASSYLYVPLYERFARIYPDVTLEITSGLGRETALARVRGGEASAAFMQLPLDADDLAHDVLGSTEMVAVAVSHARPERVLMWDASVELGRALDDAGIHVAIRTNDLALLKRFVDSGVGTAFVPRWSVTSELESGAFAIVPFDLPLIRQHFGIAYPRAARSPVLDAFLATAQEFKAVLAELGLS